MDRNKEVPERAWKLEGVGDGCFPAVVTATTAECARLGALLYWCLDFEVSVLRGDKAPPTCLGLLHTFLSYPRHFPCNSFTELSSQPDQTKAPRSLHLL